MGSHSVTSHPTQVKETVIKYEIPKISLYPKHNQDKKYADNKWGK